MIENDDKRELPSLQWFPGHMQKARRMIEENLALVDVAVELLDARIPLSSANPMMREILGDKPRLIVLNKSDLADAEETRRFLAYFKAQGATAVAVDAAQGKGIAALVKAAEELAKPRTERLLSRGATRARAARLMILGIPNVGKSSLINRLAGGVPTKTADKPGVTRAKQWIRLAENLELLDTPGILWPKFEDAQVGLKLAFTGAIRDEIYDLEQVAAILLETLAQGYPKRLLERFKLKGFPERDPRLEGIAGTYGLVLLEAVGKARGCLMRGGAVDLEKAQRIVMTEFRAGKFGRITLDFAPRNNAAEETPDGKESEGSTEK